MLVTRKRTASYHPHSVCPLLLLILALILLLEKEVVKKTSELETTDTESHVCGACLPLRVVCPATAGIKSPGSRRLITTRLRRSLHKHTHTK